MKTYIPLLLFFLLSVTAFSQPVILKRKFTLGASGTVIVIPPVIDTTNTYNLASSSRVSIGIYKTDNTLVKTLVSGETQSSGSHTLPFWDGKNDQGTLQANGSYVYKILSNNVSYTWEGVVGNTSKYFSGPTVHHNAGGSFLDMRIVGKKAVYAVEYGEGNASEFSFNTDSPQVKIPIWPNWTGSGLVITRMATDGTNLYFGGITGEFLTPKSFVYAKRVSDYGIVSFANGTVEGTTNGPNYSSAIDTMTTGPIYRVSGLAVQRTGNFLFVARRYLNSLHVLNKTTGALLQSLTYTEPQYMDCDAAGNLWMISGAGGAWTCKRYPVNVDGTLASPNLTLTGLLKPVSVNINQASTILAVADDSTHQQIMFFNASTGALIRTQGVVGGYLANGPDVADNKFHFRSTKEFQNTTYPENILNVPQCMVAFDSSNKSYWVQDVANQRMQHYDSSGNFIERIMNIGYNYQCGADANNPTRVFSNYLEFAVDYNLPLSPSNGSWTLVKNWGVNQIEATDNQFRRMYGVTTLSNGRTYCMNGKQNNDLAIAELTTSGLRFTGQVFTNVYAMNKDGSLWNYNRGGGTTTWKRQKLTGFDSSNNPIWATEVTMNAVVNTDGLDPVNDGAGFRYDQILGGGPDSLIAMYDNELSDNFHAGAMKFNSNVWLWRVSRATHALYKGDFPKDGAYDIGNGTNYSGSQMHGIERSLFWGYHGEFWKGSQANMYAHYWDNGLFVGQFGTTAQEVRSESWPEMAGNSLAHPLVKVGSDYYMYHTDESYHGGIHRWKISNLSSIVEQTRNITKSGTPTAPTLDYTDLMAGLPFNTVLVSGTAGWTRSSSEAAALMYVKTSAITYNKLNGDDLYLDGVTGTQWVKRDLGTNTGLTAWRLTCNVMYPAVNESGDNYIELLDGTDKVIARFSRPTLGYPNMAFKANSTTIVSGENDSLKYVFRRLQPLTIAVSGSNITVTYANYTPVVVTKFDVTADITNPKTLKVTLSSVTPSEHIVGIANAKFYNH